MVYNTTIKKHWDLTENKGFDLCDAEEVLSGKFIAYGLNSGNKKTQINNLTLYLKGRENEEQSTKWEERIIIKIRTEINEIETKKTRDQWNQGLILWKDKTDQPLTKLIKKKGAQTQISQILKEKWQLISKKH